MYFLRATTNFSAALYISGTSEKYKSMHGHDYNVSVVLKSDTLNSAGMVWDFSQLEIELKGISSSLDHILLNDCQEFLEENPTPENIAKYFYNKLTTNIPGLPLFEVEVEQSRGYSAIYRQ